MGPHCGLVSKKIVCLDVTLKAVVLKTPGQTNSGALCLLQDLLRGVLLRRQGAPWWRIMTKRAAIAAMRPHRAVFCHRPIVADCCPAQFADEFRRRAFNASPAFQSARWLFRSIGPESRTPSYSLLSARADAFLTPPVPFNVGFLSCGASCSFSSWSHLFWGEIKSPSRWKTATRGQAYWPSLSRPGHP